MEGNFLNSLLGLEFQGEWGDDQINHTKFSRCEPTVALENLSYTELCKTPPYVGMTCLNPL